jgi:hypothetical protein
MAIATVSPSEFARVSLAEDLPVEINPGDRFHML